MEEFKLKQGFVIAEDYEGEERKDDKTIKFITLCSWLLTQIKKPQGYTD